MRTAEQIHATRFEKIVRAGMLADADTQGAVRRATLDAAKAVVLYMQAGEVTEALRIAEEVAGSMPEGSSLADIAGRAFDGMRKAAGR